MLNRIAHSIYWMTRYLERAGETARLTEINLRYLVEAEEELNEDDKWRPILQITLSEAHYRERLGDGLNTPQVLQFVASGRGNPNSIRRCLALFRENARIARDTISKEMWAAANEIWIGLNERLQGALAAERAGSLLVELRNQVARFNGLADATMMRGKAHAFYELGQSLERAEMTSRILDVKYRLILPESSGDGSAPDYYRWAALLKSLSGFEAFCRSYHCGFTPDDVAEFVVLNGNFPRSISYLGQSMAAALITIGTQGKEGTQCSFRRLSELVQATAQELFAEGLHHYLERLLKSTAAFHLALAEEFFL